MPANPTVYIVDDTPEVLEITSVILSRQGYTTQCFDNGMDFLALDSFASIGCIILDNHMPGLTGLQVQQELLRREINLPILFLSGASDYSDVFHATRNGAAEFLQKPISAETLKSKVGHAIEASKKASKGVGQKAKFAKKLATLTRRELQVYKLAKIGRASKAIAAELTVSISTVEFHRSNILKKFNVSTLTELLALEVSLNKIPSF